MDMTLREAEARHPDLPEGLRLFPGAGAILFGALATLCYCVMARRQFGGATGDTAGFFLQLCELLCLAGAWIGGMPG